MEINGSEVKRDEGSGSEVKIASNQLKFYT
jgi:hypothetical protein